MQRVTLQAKKVSAAAPRGQLSMLSLSYWTNTFRSMSAQSLLEIHNVAPYYRTPYILSGYRPPFSVSEAVASFCRIHNEFLNMWTHMVGAVFFLILCITELMRASDMTDADFHHVHPVPSSMWLPLPSSYSFYLALVPLGGAITCLSSVLFHTIGCCSHAHYRKGMQCDGCGILATVFACQLFPIAVLWQCFPVERMVHLTVLSVLCVVSLVAVFLPQFSEFHFRKYRALLFLTTSIYWMASFVRLAYLVHRPHVNITDYPRDTEHLLLDIFGPGLPIALRVIIEDCSLGSLFIVAGALLVLSRVPERFFPGKLDLSWWSHPIWHLCTIMQSLSHYMLFRAFAVWWLSHDQARAMMCPEQ